MIVRSSTCGDRCIEVGKLFSVSMYGSAYRAESILKLMSANFS
jgi:hypothetical protein